MNLADVVLAISFERIQRVCLYQLPGCTGLRRRVCLAQVASKPTFIWVGFGMKWMMGWNA